MLLSINALEKLLVLARLIGDETGKGRQAGDTEVYVVFHDSGDVGVQTPHDPVQWVISGEDLHSNKSILALFDSARVERSGNGPATRGE